MAKTRPSVWAQDRWIMSGEHWVLYEPYPVPKCRVSELTGNVAFCRPNGHWIRAQPLAQAHMLERFQAWYYHAGLNELSGPDKTMPLKTAEHLALDLDLLA